LRIPCFFEPGIFEAAYVVVKAGCDFVLISELFDFGRGIDIE